ncbi:Hypothetical protein R9X50_00089500 [Acrodontium crateriforme]|uniref:Glutaminase A n=1 Tax=Acrodontium crateriforme TaxID=150365 RepID=A0AAQ3R7L5_9PEZI|nr:Hypothetical protein R9X50_00089500 [Acrodontium crateriforme]
MRFSALLVAAGAALTYAQSSFSPLRPPAIPLAVKSPYLSTWQMAGGDNGNGGYLAGEWPTFWQGQVTGWAGFVKVDNTSYTWMGASNQNDLFVEQTSFEYTSDKSTFTMSVGGYVKMVITFLSTVTPNDMMRASLPYSYMNVEISSLDGKSHEVQLYTDISAEWVSGDHAANAQWSYGIIDESSTPNVVPPPAQASIPASHSPKTFATATAFNFVETVNHPAETVVNNGPHFRPTNFHASQKPKATKTATAPINKASKDGVAFHKVWRQEQLEFSEVNQQANWGNWYYATDNAKNLTHQSGADADVRGQFLTNGFLLNTQDVDYRAINDRYPVFGFALDLGVVTKSPVDTLFQLSLHQEHCIQFEGANGVEQLPCLWNSYFNSETAAVEFFYRDYATGGKVSSNFDTQVKKDTLAAGGQHYTSIATLAVRQAFGALEFTNTPQRPYLFLKEISSDGNAQTVDVIFPAHPIFIYSNPQLMKYILDPLFINQEAGHWPYKFSIHDLGSSFPNATGHDDGNDEMQPLEECGDMLIMTLAYAQRTNDDVYLAEHYDLLKQWTSYLIDEALIPANQISTDDFAGALANQTNLALKGIIGIEAMAQIANRTGHTADGVNYTNIAHNYIAEWEVLGVNEKAALPHATLNYGNDDSFVILYNLFADAELGLQLVPQRIYDYQSAFYPSVFNQDGVPLDTRHAYTKNDWELFAAAVASEQTKNEFTSVIAKWLDSTSTNYAFTDLYDTNTGNYPGIYFIARPVVGGMFSMLALKSAPTSGYVTSRPLAAVA